MTSEPSTDRLLLSVDDAARVLAISRPTCYRLIAAGRLRAVRIGRSRRVPTEALHEFVAALSDQDLSEADDAIRVSIDRRRAR